jgi:hypothetical protein
LEARKAMKKALVEDGIARSPIVLGRVKGWRIGMLSDFFDLLECLRSTGVRDADFRCMAKDGKKGLMFGV